jgi:hypothetical protein
METALWHNLPTLQLRPTPTENTTAEVSEHQSQEKTGFWKRRSFRWQLTAYGASVTWRPFAEVS